MKSPFQDIIPPEKRSIRNVPLKQDDKPSHSHKHGSKSHDHHKEHEVHKVLPVTKEKEEASENSSYEPKDPWAYESNDGLAEYGGAPREGLSKLMLWLIAIVCVVVLFFAVSWVFAGATVTVALKKVPIQVSETMSFYLTPSAGQIGYSTLTLSDKASVTLKATGQKQANQSAKGKIVIYNKYDGSSQRLVAGTRFRTSDGKIYKLDTAVTVPGKSGTTPGSIEAAVTAEKAGAEYNIGLVDFTIPGFEGDPRYTAFYARSKTAMSGGATGTVSTIDQDELDLAVEKLKAELILKIEDRVHKEVPQTSTLFAGLRDVSFTVGEAVPEGDGQARLEVALSVKFYAADTASLARAMLSSEGVTPLPEDLFDIDSTSLSASSTESASSTLKVAVSGKAVVKYQLDIEKFKSDIASLSKEKVVELVNSKYPQITTIATEIRPFWRSNIPENSDRIKVIEE